MNTRTIIQSGALVALIVLFGRLLGFFREWLIAYRGGATESTDIAIVLLTFPDLVVNLLLGGGLTAALVPAYKKLGSGADTALLLHISKVIGCAFLALALIIAIFASPILAILAPGLNDDFLSSSVWYFRLATLAIPMAALSGAVVSLLNAHERFILGSAGTLIFNLTVITSLLILPASETITAIAAGVLIGSILRLSAQTADLRPIWTTPVKRPNLINRRLVTQFLENFGFLTVLVILPPLARAISSLDDTGSLSLFNYAYKLVELPMGVVIGSIVTVLLPKLSTDLLPANNNERKHSTLIAGLRFTFLFSLIIAIPAAFYSNSLVKTAFFNVSLQPEQFKSLANLTSIGFIAFPFQAMLNVYASAFAASGNTRPLIATSLLMLGCVAILAPVLQTHMGLNGVMLSYGFSYIFGTIVLTRQAIRQFGKLTIFSVFQNTTKTIIIPAILGSAVAYTGLTLTSDTWMHILWGGLTFVTMLLTIIIFDQQLNRRLTDKFKEFIR